MPLADPNIYGNVPGDGPLRVGGQPYTDVRKEADLPSTMSKAAASQMPALGICRDLWEGNEAVKNKGSVYLPKNPGEEPVNYNDRLERSVYENFFGRTIEGLTGLVFKADPVLGDDVPQSLVEQWENIDNAGTHGAVFARELLQDALIAGHVCILVEFPKTGGTQTAADEMPDQRFAVRPYWVPVHKDNILSWRTANLNGHTILTQVVIKECTMVPDGEFGEKEQTRYRVLYRDDAGVVGFKLLEITDNRAVVTVDEGTYPTQTEIPLAECVTSGRKSILQSKPPCVDIAYLNVAHYQQSSDYARTLHMVVPFLFLAGGDPEPDGQEGTVVVGPNSAVKATNPQATAQYVSHAGTGISDQRQALEDLKFDIGALGLSMLSPQSRTQETATAHRLDKATQESALSVSARGLQDGLERAAAFHAKYLGLPAPRGGSITVNRDFEGLLMQADVMSAFGTLVAAGFPPRVVLKEFQKGGRIPEDENLEELEAEWLGGIEAERQKKQAEADMRADQTQGEAEAA